MNENEELEKLRKENEELKKQIKNSSNDSTWDFKWDGRGNYEESRRCFYGDFS